MYLFLSAVVTRQGMFQRIFRARVFDRSSTRMTFKGRKSFLKFLKLFCSARYAVTVEMILASAKWQQIYIVGAWIPSIRITNTLEYQRFWSLDFQWFGFGMVGHSYSYGANHSKTEPLEIWTKWLPYCLDCQWFWTKWPPFCSKWNAITKEPKVKRKDLWAPNLSGTTPVIPRIWTT